MTVPSWTRGSSSSLLSLLLAVLMLLLPVSLLLTLTSAQEQGDDGNWDRFNYRDTDTSHGDYNDYGPPDWDRVMCPDLDACYGWPDKWKQAHGWELETNHCRWCPEGSNSCGSHHQSPINLKRSTAIEGEDDYNECVDVHWMSYNDSTCEFDELRQKRAFVIDRHALRIVQPMAWSDALGKYRLDCNDGTGRRWGRIDFSKGFSHWWLLSHVDVHVPSEHTQEGKRYSGELQMYHFYSLPEAQTGIHNEMASVTTFLEAYDDAPDYDFLNRIICAWREEEERVRAECGLPSVTAQYPGCVYYARGHAAGGDGDPPVTTQATTEGVRHLRRTQQQQHQTDPTVPSFHRVMSAHDLILHNHYHMAINATYQPKMIHIEEDDLATPAMDDFDWDAFIQQQYGLDEQRQSHRHLLNYEHVGPWFNYFPMIGVRTEYYYRYSGTQTIPPCYGQFFSGSEPRKNTNHWRIMKDPIRVSNRQIDELHRLLRERIAPAGDPVFGCKADTAAKPDLDDPSKVSTARPLMNQHKAHFKVFCECQDWSSKWEEDKKWCRISNQRERYFDHPYNYETDGF